MCSPKRWFTSVTRTSPSRLAEPSGSVSIRARPATVVPGSPTIRATSDSNVTSPAVPPYSSMTSASPTPRRRISASRSSAPSVSGTVSASRASAADVDPAAGGRDRLQQIGDVQDADHVVQILAVHRQAGVAVAADQRDHIVARGVGRDADDLGARYHHLAGGQIREPEHAMEHLFFLLFEDAGLLARGHQHLQLFFRVHHARGSRDPRMPSRFTTALPHSVQQPDERPERRHEQFGGLDHQQGGRLRRVARAMVFGASSPRTMCNAVTTANAIATAML